MFSTAPTRLHSANHANATISVSGKSTVKRSPLSANVWTLTTCAGKVIGSAIVPYSLRLEAQRTRPAVARLIHLHRDHAAIARAVRCVRTKVHALAFPRS